MRIGYLAGNLAIVVLAGWAPHEGSAEIVTDVLNDRQWRRVDDAVDRGLRWLARRQRRDGSFRSIDIGQPGVTSLGLLAFAAHGHLPGEGVYAVELNKALDFVLTCQQPSGLLAQRGPPGSKLSRNVVHAVGQTSTYNHALAGLALSESFAMSVGDDEQRLQVAIVRALAVTLEMQQWSKDRRSDLGGWRYLHNFDHRDSDLSAAGWHLMFLRSAKNAGFDVPPEPIAAAVAYVRRCYRPNSGAFSMLAGDDGYRSRGMTGAGILALAHAGLHESAEAKHAGDWLLENGFRQYNQPLQARPFLREDRFHYATFTCSQAMYQLGGRYWRQFFPPTVELLLANQNGDGSWEPEQAQDRQYGNAYTTAMALLTLGAPNQLLPVLQR